MGYFNLQTIISALSTKTKYNFFKYEKESADVIPRTNHNKKEKIYSVSYTHLTLPTILLV